MNKYLIVLFFCLNIANSFALEQYERVSISEIITAKDENGIVSVKFVLSVPSNTLEANDILTLTPILITKDGHELYNLPSIYACGRVGDLTLRRKQAFSKNTDAPRFLVHNKGTLAYSFTFAYKSWMQTATLVLHSHLRNCCKEREFPDRELYTCSFAGEVPVKKVNFAITQKEPPITLGITERLAQTENFIESIENYVPQQKNVVGKQEKAQIIFFKSAKAEIDCEYLDNEKVLQHVIDVTRQIHNDPEAEIAHIVLLGLSSPEGSYDYNVKLAASRSKAMKQYILSHISLPDSCFELVNGGEGWDELRYLVERSDMSSKEEILQIIDGVSAQQGRKIRLMKLDRGVPYLNIKEHLFPKLRRAGYIKVYYRKRKID